MNATTQRPEAKQHELSHLSRSAIELLERTRLDTAARSIRTECLARLDQPLYTVAFIGAFNSGKSSLVNALLGRELLATGVLPTTAVVTEIVHGAAESCDVHRPDGSVEAGRPLSELPELCRAGEAVARIVIHVPAPWLAGGVRIVDTPGVQSVHDQHDAITFGYLPVADAVVLCMPANRPLSRGDLELLRDQVLARDIRKLFFVLTQSDLLSVPEAEAVEAFAAKELTAVVPQPRVFCLSARDGLAARIAGDRRAEGFCGLEPFEKALRAFFSEEKEGERARRVASGLDRHLASAVDELVLEKATLEQDEKGLEGAVCEARKALDGASAEGRRIASRLEEGLAGLRAEARDSVQAAVARAGQAAQARLQGASFDQLKDAAAIEAAIRSDLQSSLEGIAKDLTARLEELRQEAGLSIGETIARLRADVLGAVHVAVPARGLLALPDELFMIAEVLVLDVLLPGGLLAALAAKLLGRWLSPKLGDAIGNLLKALVVNLARGKVLDAVAAGMDEIGVHLQATFDDRLAEAAGQLCSSAQARFTEECRGLEAALDRAVAERSQSKERIAARRRQLGQALDALGKIRGQVGGFAAAVPAVA